MAIHKTFKTLLLLFLLFLLAPSLEAKSSFEPAHSIQVSDFVINPSHLSCLEDFTLFVDLRNAGTFTETVYVELVSSTLGIDEFSPIFSIPSDTVEIATFAIDLKDVVEGQHEFEAVVFYNQQSTRRYKTFTFTCEKEEFSTTPVAIDPIAKDQEIQEQPSLPSLQLKTSILVTLLLVIGVIILSILYGVKTYLEKE